MFCRKCGKEVKSDDRCCTHCGASLLPTDQKQERSGSFWSTAGDISQSNEKRSKETGDRVNSVVFHNEPTNADSPKQPNDSFFHVPDKHTHDSNPKTMRVDDPPVGDKTHSTSPLKVKNSSSASVREKSTSVGKGITKRKKRFNIGRKHAVFAICAAVLILIGATTGVLLMLNNDHQPVDSPSKQAESALDAVLAAPISEVETEGEETPAFLSEMEDQNGYEILSFEETDDGAVATLKVYAPDLYSVAKQLDSELSYETEEEMLAAIDLAIKNAPTVERQVELNFEKTDEGYQPILTDEFLDVYYGGVFRLYKEMLTESVNRSEGNQ